MRLWGGGQLLAVPIMLIIMFINVFTVLSKFFISTSNFIN